MAEKYYWSLSQMQAVRSSTATMHEAVNDSLTQVNALIAAVEADASWVGDHKTRFLAWMDLMKQFNAKVAAEDVGGAAREAVQDFTTQLADFYADSPSMARLRSVS